MIECRFRPVSEWPGTPKPTWKQKAGSFKAGWSQTLDLLEKELNHLRAKEIVIEGYFEFGQIRNDGWPKSSARPSKPGVILSFERRNQSGRIVMPCDTFDNWESNLRAIALTLKHLRAVERYGVTSDKQEQYTGWLKLPAASADDEASLLARTLCELAGLGADSVGELLTNRFFFDSTWKEAALKTHPDKIGGNGDKIRQVIAARDRIRKLKGWPE